MSLKVEVIADGRMNGCEFLQTSFEAEPGHGSLSSPKWEMGILGVVIIGKTRPDTGTVLFKGSIDLTKSDETDIANLGVGRKFQKPTIFEHHTGHCQSKTA